MNPQSVPKLIVGVDLGFTCTGVAFCSPDKVHPTIIYKWPQNRVEGGAEGVVHKVPTRVSYRAGREGYSWGLQCPSPGDIRNEMIVKEHFKLYLDPDVLNGTFGNDPDLAPGTIRDVRNWFRDFLTALYKYIVWYLNELFPQGLETERVEYIFSVPTTWKKRPVIQNFEEIVKKAGFGDNDNHTVTIGLSEAEGAAIYTAMYPSEHRIVRQPEVGTQTDVQAAADAAIVSYEKGDILLVCDAGGGTTDVCVLEVMSNKDEPIELEQLSYVKGKPIGSVQIDDNFKAIVEERLSKVNKRLRLLDPPVIPKHAAREITRGQFQHHKEQCGTRLANLEVIAITVPDLPPDFDESDVNIEKGKMMFSKEDIEGLFEQQIEGIIRLIDAQLKGLKKDSSSKRVSYIVLSGGLSSSKYVQERIRSNYHNDGMNILVSEEPQLAVCKGLVIDRIHRLRHASAFAIRRCRASYGILFNEEVKKSPLGGKKLLTDRIAWLVKKGEPLRRDTPIECKLSRIVNPDNPEKAWEDKFAISSARKGRLPKHIGEGDARVVLTVESDLRSHRLSPGAPGVGEVKRWLGLRQALLKVDYHITVSIRPAELLFESWFCDERIGGGAVPVSWKKFPEEDEGQDDGDEDEEDRERPTGPFIRF